VPLIYGNNMRTMLLEVMDKCFILVFESLNLTSIHTMYLKMVRFKHRFPHYILLVRGWEFY